MMVNRLALTLVFTLSFLTYTAPDLSVSLQLVPLVLFAVLVFGRVFFSDSVFRAVGSLFELDGLLFVIFVALLLIVTSIESTFGKSLEMASLIAACLILARLYMAVIPIREVLEAYFWSGILSVGILVPLAFGLLTESFQTLGRFSPLSFHPNLLAFLLAGYFCAMVWKIMTGGWVLRIMAGIVGLLCLVIIFFASSRGSMVAILTGCVLVAGMTFTRAEKQSRKRALRWGVLACALLLGFALFVQELEVTSNVLGFLEQVVQLTSEERGIDSGFTGRVDKWKEIMRIFRDGTFLVGRGVRSSDHEELLIDNSYLVILYECGLTALLLITWRFLSILRAFLKGYLRARGHEEISFCLACSFLIAVLLVNGIVDRHLFSVGNPYSLLALFLFAAPTALLEQRVGAYKRPRLRGPDKGFGQPGLQPRETLP